MLAQGTFGLWRHFAGERYAIPFLTIYCIVFCKPFPYQSRNDVDGALSKYSQIAQAEPEIAELWNNIGLCFFKKQKFIVVTK